MSMIKVNTKTKKRGIGNLIFGGVIVLGLGSGAVLAGINLYEKVTGKVWDASSMSFTASSVGAVDMVKGAGTTANVMTLDDNYGDASTLTVNAYDTTADSETEVTVPMGVYAVAFGEDGAVTELNKVLDVDAFTTASSLTGVKVGDSLALFGGNGSYYVDPVLDYPVVATTGTLNIDARTIASESSMSVVVYDDNNDALTADDDAENTADYSLAFGSDESIEIRPEIKLAGNNANYQLKGIALAYEGNVDEVEILDGDWTLITTPKELRNADVVFANDANANTTGEYKLTYVYKAGTSETISLSEFEKSKLRIKVTADGNPSANSGDFVAGLFLDGAWAENKAGDMEFDIFAHDDDEKVSDVGLDETETSPQGLQVGFMVELQ